LTDTFDLASLDTTKACNDGAEVEIRHPVTNVPLGMTIRVLGRDSDTFKEFTRDMLNTRLRREAMAQKRGKDADLRTVEVIEQENMDLLVTCTLGWKGVVDAGETLDFNEANVRKIYKKYPWIYDQVNEAIGTLELFLKN
jgi:hypothetical protein